MLSDAPLKPVEGDFARRWSADDFFDLIVWYDPGDRIHGFQLCYDKSGRERALTWTQDGGFLHTAVDSGEATPTANRTPFLVPADDFPPALVAREFAARSAGLSPEICDLVLVRMEEYARGGAGSG